MNDLLLYVRQELVRSIGDLPKVSRDTGIAYDTVLRIKNGEGDPGYSKVRTLAEYFHRRREKEAAHEDRGPSAHELQEAA